MPGYKGHGPLLKLIRSFWSCKQRFPLLGFAHSWPIGSLLGPLPAPMPIRFIYSSKHDCRPSFKHRDGVQGHDSPHPAVEFVLFRMPVWGSAGCTCLWCSGNSGAWELHSFFWSLSVSHSSPKYPKRAGGDSWAGELLFLD